MKNIAPVDFKGRKINDRVEENKNLEKKFKEDKTTDLNKDFKNNYNTEEKDLKEGEEIEF